MRFVPLEEKMKTFDNATQNSTMWFEYEELEPIVIQGYLTRDQIKVNIII